MKELPPGRKTSSGVKRGLESFQSMCARDLIKYVLIYVCSRGVQKVYHGPHLSNYFLHFYLNGETFGLKDESDAIISTITCQFVALVSFLSMSSTKSGEP